MKNKNVKKIIIIAIILLVVIGIILAILNKNAISLNRLEYDILVESNRYQYEGVDPMYVPDGGYSSNYYYTLINSVKKEKYTIAYQDVWDVHNEKGDKDKVTITINKIDDNELQENINKYGKSSKLLSVKKLLDEHSNEKYEVVFNN